MLYYDSCKDELREATSVEVLRWRERDLDVVSSLDFSGLNLSPKSQPELIRELPNENHDDIFQFGNGKAMSVDTMINRGTLIMVGKNRDVDCDSWL